MRKLALCALLWAAALVAQPGPNYTKLVPRGLAPEGRADGAIAYDPAGKRIWMFGGLSGGARNDFWAFSIERQEWTEITPTGNRPPARFGHTLTYDPVRRRLVVFGGQASGFFSDVWAYSIESNSWQLLAPDGTGPSRRYGHSGIHDPARDRIVISHGFTDSGRFDDTWAFHLASNTWQNLSPASGRPLRRCLHHAVLDEARNQMLLFGGCASGFGPCPLGDLWSFDLTANRWTERTGSVKPSPREWHGLAFDTKRQRLVLFGGAGSGGNLNDTWEYDPAINSWSQATPQGDIPSPRSRHEAAYAVELGAAFFFGGQSNSGSSNELYMLGGPERPRISGGGVQNAFSAQGGAVAPAEIVSLYGAFGVADPVSASFDASGNLPRTLGGLSVTFNGQQAAFYYAAAGQVNVQVPAELTGQEAEIIVSYLGIPSVPERVRVERAHPGLFPRAFQEADILVMFATGQGPGNAVEFLIGGRPAELLYAGPTPGTVGVFQVNARIPGGIGAGETVPVVLRSSGFESPAVMVTVR